MEGIFLDLTTYGYIGLFIYSLGGGFVALLAGSVLAYMDKMDITYVISIAFIANFIGDILLFQFARLNKSKVLEQLKNHKRKVALSHLLLRKYGSYIVVFQKYIQGIRTLIPITIGISKYDFKKFLILNFIGSTIWSLTIGITGFLTGKYFIDFIYLIGDKPWIMLIFGGSIGLLIWIFFNIAVKKKI